MNPFAASLLLALTLSASAYSTSRFSASTDAVAPKEPVGSEYEALPAQEKLDLIWNLITKDTTPGTWLNPILSNARLLLLNMNPTMEFVGDQLPSGRTKLIHQVGVVAQIEWTPAENNPYTGLFTGGRGVLRWGFAAKPDTSSTGGPYGLAIKLFRDGLPSGNFVNLYTFNDWPSFNPLYFPYSNILSKPTGSALETVQKKFETATKWALGVGLSDFAKYDASGAVVSDISFPFRLALVPNRTVRSRISDSYVELSKILKTNFPAGSVLFDVYAYDAPGSQPVFIGSIRSISEFTPTAFEKIFFRHTRLEEDVALRPELEAFFTENEKTVLPNLPGVDTYPPVVAV